jgi:hypothetical protein
MGPFSNFNKFLKFTGLLKQQAPNDWEKEKAWILEKIVE